MTLPRLLTLAALAFFLRADDSADELLAAARKGETATVKRLLDAGVDVNVKSPYGSTPLFFACDHGHVEVVKLLLERGADVNVEDTFYHATALVWAMNKNNAEIVKLLLGHGAKSATTVLMGAVRSGDARLVGIALDTGGIDKAALTSALTAAAGKPEIVEMLKAAGAEPLKTVQLDEATLASYAGTYGASASGTEVVITFAVQNGNLSGTIGGQRFTYAATDKTHFSSIEPNGGNLDFNSDGVRLNNQGFTLDFKRKAQPK